jgi:hypothetical protein
MTNFQEEYTRLFGRVMTDQQSAPASVADGEGGFFLWEHSPYFVTGTSHTPVAVPHPRKRSTDL